MGAALHDVAGHLVGLAVLLGGGDVRLGVLGLDGIGGADGQVIDDDHFAVTQAEDHAAVRPLGGDGAVVQVEGPLFEHLAVAVLNQVGIFAGQRLAVFILEDEAEIKVPGRPVADHRHRDRQGIGILPLVVEDRAFGGGRQGLRGLVQPVPGDLGVQGSVPVVRQGDAGHIAGKVVHIVHGAFRHHLAGQEPVGPAGFADVVADLREQDGAAAVVDHGHRVFAGVHQLHGRFVHLGDVELEGEGLVPLRRRFAGYQLPRAQADAAVGEIIGVGDDKALIGVPGDLGPVAGHLVFHHSVDDALALAVIPGQFIEGVTPAVFPFRKGRFFHKLAVRQQPDVHLVGPDPCRGAVLYPDHHGGGLHRRRFVAVGDRRDPGAVLVRRHGAAVLRLPVVERLGSLPGILDLFFAVKGLQIRPDGGPAVFFVQGEAFHRLAVAQQGDFQLRRPLAGFVLAVVPADGHGGGHVAGLMGIGNEVIIFRRGQAGRNVGVLGNLALPGLAAVDADPAVRACLHRGFLHRVDDGNAAVPEPGQVGKVGPPGRLFTAVQRFEARVRLAVQGDGHAAVVFRHDPSVRVQRKGDGGRPHAVLVVLVRPALAGHDGHDFRFVLVDDLILTLHQLAAPVIPGGIHPIVSLIPAGSGSALPGQALQRGFPHGIGDFLSVLKAVQVLKGVGPAKLRAAAPKNRRVPAGFPVRVQLDGGAFRPDAVAVAVVAPDLDQGIAGLFRLVGGGHHQALVLREDAGDLIIILESGVEAVAGGAQRISFRIRRPDHLDRVGHRVSVFIFRLGVEAVGPVVLVRLLGDGELRSAGLRPFLKQAQRHAGRPGAVLIVAVLPDQGHRDSAVFFQQACILGFRIRVRHADGNRFARHVGRQGIGAVKGHPAGQVPAAVFPGQIQRAVDVLPGGKVQPGFPDLPFDAQAVENAVQRAAALPAHRIGLALEAEINRIAGGTAPRLGQSVVPKKAPAGPHGAQRHSGQDQDQAEVFLHGIFPYSVVGPAAPAEYSIRWKIISKTDRGLFATEPIAFLRFPAEKMAQAPAELQPVLTYRNKRLFSTAKTLYT